MVKTNYEKFQKEITEIIFTEENPECAIRHLSGGKCIFPDKCDRCIKESENWLKSTADEEGK